jgi:hypothetical protein
VLEISISERRRTLTVKKLEILFFLSLVDTNTFVEKRQIYVPLGARKGKNRKAWRKL